MNRKRKNELIDFAEFIGRCGVIALIIVATEANSNELMRIMATFSLVWTFLPFIKKTTLPLEEQEDGK